MPEYHKKIRNTESTISDQNNISEHIDVVRSTVRWHMYILNYTETVLEGGNAMFVAQTVTCHRETERGRPLKISVCNTGA